MHTPSDPRKPILLSEPLIGRDEWELVRDCLESGWVSSAGEYVSQFEEQIAAKSGRRYAVATTNGTSALHLALTAAGVGSGDEVLVSSLSFIAPANAVTYTGAEPVFIDADRHTWQMDPNLVHQYLTEQCRLEAGALVGRSSGRRVAAVLPVDILGHPVDMDALQQIASEFEIPIVEDASEALGAQYKGEPVGSKGLAACFSFNGNKVVTTGGGGMVVTDDEDLASSMKYLSTQAKDDPVNYVHHNVGFNYRLPNILAALGIGQIASLSERVDARRAIAQRYAEGLGSIREISMMPEAPWARSSCWLSTMLLDAASPVDRAQMIRSLNQRNVQVRPLWEPLHLSRAHEASLAVGGRVAESLQSRAVSLPSSAQLDRETQEHVMDLIKQIYESAPASDQA